MIQINSLLKLQPIKSSDVDTLYSLMSEIYPPAYKHFWKDSGVWYVNSQYSKPNVLEEISKENTDYYFIFYNNEIVGNIRIIWNESLEGVSEEKQLKLHRLYLHQKTQGKGIGKKLLSWLENEAVKKRYKIIWLDAMDEQPQAFQFYKKLGYKYHSHIFLDFKNMHDEVRKMSQVYKEL